MLLIIFHKISGFFNVACSFFLSLSSFSTKFYRTLFCCRLSGVTKNRQKKAKVKLDKNQEEAFVSFRFVGNKMLKIEDFNPDRTLPRGRRMPFSFRRIETSNKKKKRYCRRPNLFGQGIGNKLVPDFFLLRNVDFYNNKQNYYFF